MNLLSLVATPSESNESGCLWYHKSARTQLGRFASAHPKDEDDDCDDRF